MPEEEQIQFTTWMFSWFRVLEQAHHYHAKGILDEAVWEGHVTHMKQLMKSSILRIWWNGRKSFFSKSFQEFVNEMIDSESKAINPRELIESMRD